VTLEDLGFSPALAEALEALSPGAEPARVVATLSDSLRVVTPRGDTVARISGRLRHSAASPSELPAVGDWVALRRERIAAVLPRRTTLSRKVPGRRAEEHVVAANVDTVIIVMGVDDDYSTRRLERYLATVWESGARPVVLLSKADLDPTVDARVREVEGLAIGTPVIAASVVEGRGVDQLRALLLPRETNVLVGSSGVGKSTLINTLLGEDRQATRATSARDARGQHTTTHRELFRLPGGSLLIDSPGIRELQLWVDEESLSRSFGDIAALALECRYRDSRRPPPLIPVP
jgi:ribosome biogenesis GTPase